MTQIVDYFSLWTKDRMTDPQRRDQQTEANFWVGHAPVYDDNAGRLESSYGQIGMVISLIDPGLSVLDVGGGTGRFALPLAQRGCQVTVLDRSADMLAVLAQKISAHHVDIEMIHRTWPHVMDRRYDVVLAAWSLYWNIDLKASLEAMVDHAKKRIIIIDTTGSPTPYDLALGQGRVEIQQARHLLFAGGLAQLGLSSTIHIVTDCTFISERRGEQDCQQAGIDIRQLTSLCESYRVDGGWNIPRQIAVVVAEMNQPIIRYRG